MPDLNKAFQVLKKIEAFRAKYVTTPEATAAFDEILSSYGIDPQDGATDELMGKIDGISTNAGGEMGNPKPALDGLPRYMRAKVGETLQRNEAKRARDFAERFPNARIDTERSSSGLN